MSKHANIYEFNMFRYVQICLYIMFNICLNMFRYVYSRHHVWPCIRYMQTCSCLILSLTLYQICGRKNPFSPTTTIFSMIFQYWNQNNHLGAGMIQKTMKDGSSQCQNQTCLRHVQICRLDIFIHNYIYTFGHIQTCLRIILLLNSDMYRHVQIYSDMSGV